MVAKISQPCEARSACLQNIHWRIDEVLWKSHSLSPRRRSLYHPTFCDEPRSHSGLSAHLRRTEIKRLA